MIGFDRTILELSDINDLRIDRIFCRLVGFSEGQIPEKMVERVEDTRKWAVEHFKVISVYESVLLDACDPDEDDIVATVSGQKFKSSMMKELLRDSEVIVGIASMLEGLDEAMEQYPETGDQVYIDAWATAILSSANLDLRMRLKKEIEEAGLYTTATWSPGQHGFHISNQVPFFELFRPEEIGISLKETLMMDPKKSTTLMFGISRRDQKDSPPPCAFCSSKDTCPNAFAEQSYGI